MSIIRKSSAILAGTMFLVFLSFFNRVPLLWAASQQDQQNTPTTTTAASATATASASASVSASASAIPSATLTATETIVDTKSPTPSLSASVTSSISPTPIFTLTPSSTTSTTPTASETISSTPTASGTAAASESETATTTASPTNTTTTITLQKVIINELAWAGSAASASDEWIELYNPSTISVDLTGWELAAADGSPTIHLSGTIPAQGYYLLERTDDNTVSDILADQIYTGNLGNGGETLRLFNSHGDIVDTANLDGGAWPAGTGSQGSPAYASMARLNHNTPDIDTNWGSNNGSIHNGADADGNPLNGTPKALNSLSQSVSPTGTPTQTPSVTSLPTATYTFMPSATPTNSFGASPTATASASTTLTPSDTPSPSLSPSLSPSPSLSLSPSPSPSPFPAGSVRINEIAWAGTLASTYDEWIELYNPTAQTIDLDNWSLVAADGNPSISLEGTIPAHGYFLLERTDDTTVSDITADQIYTGTLSNSGETLYLRGPSGETIDVANPEGGIWPAGENDSRASMERYSVNDDWGTNNGQITHGQDANGNAVPGTPKYANSIWFPVATATASASATATPSPTPSPSPSPSLSPSLSPSPTQTLSPSTTATITPSPSQSPSPTLTGTSSPTPSNTPSLSPSPSPFPAGSVRINEIAWAGTLASSYDEWIELYNPTAQAINLTHWTLSAADGTPNITLEGSIPAYGYYLLERTDDSTIADIPADLIYSGTLSNDGETLFLRGPSGEIIDVANPEGEAWPAGDNNSRASMERYSISDDWGTNSGQLTHGKDANGQPVPGTPKYANSIWFPANTATTTPTASSTPSLSPSPSLSPTPTLSATITVSPSNTASITYTTTITPSPTSSPTVTPSVTSTFTATPSNTPSPTATITSTPPNTLTASYTVTITPSPTNSHTTTPTRTSSPSPSPSLSPSPSPSPTATTIPVGSVLINEIAWAGTSASSYDEWIELYNPGEHPINLEGCLLISDDGSPTIELTGSIPAKGYYLLERSADDTVADIPADLIYTGNLSNGGETLRLIGPAEQIIDTANLAAGSWPAGDSSTRTSMERRSEASDTPSGWGSNTSYHSNGLDAQGNPINGSPGQPNSIWFSTPTPTASNIPSATATTTASATATQTMTATSSATTTPLKPVLINEIAWSGTIGHYNDEWIELYNPGNQDVDLEGWRLISADGKPEIELEGVIPAWGYFLLERTDDTSVADIPADLIYTGSLSNDGEILYLLSPLGDIVDRANEDGGDWPAGDSYEHISMERAGNRANGSTIWRNNTGYVHNGLDVDGYPIWGTPRQRNSLEFPTPTPTLIPDGTKIAINEYLPRPKYDWNQDGRFSSGDEFIELTNLGTISVNLLGWHLDDSEGGSAPYELPTIILAPGENVVLFRSQTRLSLSDSGDMVRLFDPTGKLVDEHRYNYAKDINISWCRLDENSDFLSYPCWPTPGDQNAGYSPGDNTNTKAASTPSVNPSAHGPKPAWLIPGSVCGFY